MSNDEGRAENDGAMTSGYMKSLAHVIEEFSKLPGIGPRTAERLAFHLLRGPTEEALGLADAIRDLKKNLKICSRCFNLAENDPCAVCTDSRRDASVLCVVEQSRDVLAIERTGEYNGVYHVLQGRICPLENITPDELTVAALLKRVQAGQIGELILATNPDLEGDMTAEYIAEQLKDQPVKITRPARGVPVGSQMEFVGKATLADALRGRRPWRS